ncbi:MAG TPA: (Fe-S)-binding protein [Actinomycetota bacterium]|nr:(Fe-S)-binding protein [Actinomycetota bacterium]
MDTIARISLAVSIVMLASGLAMRRISFLTRLLMAGKPDPERFKGVGSKLKAELVKVLGQKKLFQRLLPGTAHAFTFWGFLVVQITLVESIGEVFDREFAIPGPGRWEALGFIQDIFMLAIMIALVTFAGIRIAQSPKREGRKSRFFGSHIWQAYVILFLIFAVVSTVLVVRGARAALGTLPYPDGAFLSSWIGDRLSIYTTESLHLIEDWWLLGHLAVVFGFLVLVVNSKHLHIFTSPLNVMFGRQPIALGPLKPLHIDMEKMTEETSLGVGKVEDFTWKQMLDGYTCTECGRCQAACPAWNTGKELNPKLIITNLRDHLFEKSDYLLGKATEEEAADVLAKSLVPDVISSEALWACVTCGACVQECPVDIEHVDAIVDMRRYQVMMESQFPSEAGVMLRNLENSGNPWGAAASARMDWAKGIEDFVPVVNGRIPPEAEYLYWVGCAGAFDDRAKKAVNAFARLMVEAGVGFAVLGPQESCTGDPARRIGNEYLFQEMAKANIATLKEKGVRKIVASCPHCFNTMAREYPQFGGTFEVLHHSQLLERLVADGKIVPTKELEARITYHDPCYLARHNDVIDEPRHLLDNVPGLAKQEMPRCRKGTFCCGAGGARMWMEETEGKRINHERIDEALETNPDMVSTGCPFCMIMLDDAVKDRAQQGKASEDLKVYDVAQILAQSVALNKTGGAAPRPPAAAVDAPAPE